MNRYRVELRIPITIQVDVEATNEEEAADIAESEADWQQDGEEDGVYQVASVKLLEEDTDEEGTESGFTREEAAQ